MRVQLVLIGLVTLWLTSGFRPDRRPPEGSGADDRPRPVVVVSDLHLGLGRNDGGWLPTEDFRWPRALAAFLEAVSRDGGERVDLVVAGDFLELWQPPAAGEWCPGPPPPASTGEASGVTPGYGCTVAEMRELAGLVVAAHPEALGALARFAATGENCLVVVPGNHDAALLLDPVWEPLGAALGAGRGCVRRAEAGVWASPDGRLVVEHGHQIGWDANRYDGWPGAIARRFGDREYLERPWGERFVQRIFNREEAELPLIDNLAPTSAGARYRMADRGWSGTAEDAVRFLRFNLFDTSLRQKVQILGGEEAEPPRWDAASGRDLGHELFAGALAPDDPFAAALREGGGEWERLRAELDAAARELPEPEILSLCDGLAIRGGARTCRIPVMGAAAERLVRSRERVLRGHLAERHGRWPEMRTFVYGHTHAFELPWQVETDELTAFQVANTGAFQRVMDEDRLRALARERETAPVELLRGNALDNLPPCYTSVHVTWRGPFPSPEVRAWAMTEDASEGRFVDPCDPLCAVTGHGCSG